MLLLYVYCTDISVIQWVYVADCTFNDFWTSNLSPLPFLSLSACNTSCSFFIFVPFSLCLCLCGPVPLQRQRGDCLTYESLLLSLFTGMNGELKSQISFITLIYSPQRNMTTHNRALQTTRLKGQLTVARLCYSPEQLLTAANVSWSAQLAIKVWQYCGSVAPG